MPVKAPLGSSPLMLALQVKTVCTEADVLMLVVASLSIWKKEKEKEKGAVLGNIGSYFGIKVDGFAMIWIQNNCFKWLLNAAVRSPCT